jgi:hypothetical protein
VPFPLKAGAPRRPRRWRPHAGRTAGRPRDHRAAGAPPIPPTGPTRRLPPPPPAGREGLTAPADRAPPRITDLWTAWGAFLASIASGGTFNRHVSRERGGGRGSGEGGGEGVDEGVDRVA